MGRDPSSPCDSGSPAVASRSKRYRLQISLYSWPREIMGVMPENRIACVIWHRHGHEIEVIYAGGESDYLFGKTKADAAVLAESAELSLVDSRDGMVRWIKVAGHEADPRL